MAIDFDKPDPHLVAELMKVYQSAAGRLKVTIIRPPGSTDSAREFNQARASELMHQVKAEISSLKGDVSKWSGKALTKSIDKGIAVADGQARDAGIRPENVPFKGRFSVVDRDAVQVLARDTTDDLIKAADSMERTALTTLRRCADVGVSNTDINRILAGGVIEGKPRETTQQLKQLLEKVNGETVTVPTKSGGEITFDTGYYAQMVAQTKTREATVLARHSRLEQHGMDLVEVVGRNSKNPCSMLLGEIFSLSGKDKRYPAFSTVSAGQPPYRLFHPNCSKSTAPFVDGLSVKQTRGEEAAAA